MAAGARRWWKRGLISLLVAPPLLVALVLGALALPLTRAPIVRQALKMTNASLDGIRIELDEVGRLDLWGIDVRGVRVFDEQRRQIVSVRAASVRVLPLSLLRSTLRLTQVSVAGARVTLYPAKEEPEEPASGPWSFQVLAERVRVSDAALDVQLSGRALHLVIQTLSAGAAYGPRTAATVHEAALFADLDGQRALTLRTTRGSWDEQQGGQVSLAGELLDGRLELTARVPALESKAPWPLEQANLKLTGLSPAGLARVGLADAVQLRAPLSLAASARTSGERLEAQLTLSAGDLELLLNGVATPALYSVRAQLAPTQLSAVSGVLPELRLGFDLHAELRPKQQPMAFELEWRDLELEGRAVPQGALSATVSLPKLELTRLGLRGLERALRLRGKYDLERGSGELSFDSSELQLSDLGGLVPAGLAGTLNGGLVARLDDAQLQANAALSLRALRLADASVESASLTLSLAGALSDPRGDLQLSAQQIKSGETTIDRVTLQAHAGLRDLGGKLRVDAADRHVALDILGKRRPDGSLLIDAGGTGHVRGKQMGLKLVELVLAGGAYSVRELSAFSGRESVRVSGTFDAQRQLSGSLSIRNLDVAPWVRLGLSHELTGTLDVSARAQGSLEVPKLAAQVSLRGVHSASTPRAPKVDLKSELLLDFSKRTASLVLGAHSSDRRVLVDLSVKSALFARARDLGEAFERASYDAKLEARSDVPFVAQFAGDALTQLDGKLEAQVRARGTLDAPVLNASIGAQLSAVKQPNVGRDRVDFELALTRDAAQSRLSVADRHGELLLVSGEVSLPEGGPRAVAQDVQRLLASPAKLSLRLAERRLDQLQGALGQLAQQYGFALPVRPAAELSVDSSGSALTANLRARAHAWAKGLDVRCANEAELDAVLSASVKDERLMVSLEAVPSGGGKARLELTSKLAASSLLKGAAFSWGPASLRVRGEQLALHNLPGLCMLPPASTGFAIVADDVGKGPLRGTLELKIDDLRAGDDGVVGVQLRATTDAAAVQVSGGFTLAGARAGRLKARIPLAYAADSQLPALALDKPLYAELSLPGFPLSALTSFTTEVGRAGGIVKADLRLSGSLSAPQPGGFVELRDASFSIASLAQPFSRVNGRLELSKDKLTIRTLTATDRSGKLSLKGYARYTAGHSGDAKLYVSANKFPIRQQGRIVGEISTRAELEGKMDALHKLTLLLEIQEGRVWLTGKGGQQVQELEDHPDVRYKGDDVVADEGDEASDSAVSLAELRIHSVRDLWLMHEDFSVQVEVDLRLRTDENRATLAGEAILKRGELSLLGKPFRIERGTVRFTGDVPPDPELDLRAKYALRNGKNLVVQVQGRASAPQIVFSDAARNAGEAAMLLSGMGGSGAQSKAQGDVTNFAAGLTAGLLAVSARRRFGDWVPMLGVESNAAGAPSGARAGFDASRLIPEFMQGFARSMFVEGVVGSRTDTASRSVGVGVRVEVALPRDFMTSMGYGPGTTWSTDVYWSP